MYCTPPATRTAKKPHRCMNCAEFIGVGVQYKRWMSVVGGKAQTNKMHPECLKSLEDEHGGGYFEYTLYEGVRPESL